MAPLIVAVDRILSARDYGCVWSGNAADGKRAIVVSAEPLWPVVGEVYEVEGEEVRFVDERGRGHRQIRAGRLTRVRASGRLVLPWLQSLPGIGAERARRLFDRFGQDLPDALEDPGQIGGIAEAIDPSRSALGQRIAGIVQARYAKALAEEKVGIAEGRFYARLEEFGVAERGAARRLWRLIGSADAWEALARRPYSVAAVLGWRQADHLGQRLLSAALGARDVSGHPDRLAGACDSVVRDILAEGDTAALARDFLDRLRKKGVPAERALAAGTERRRVVPFGGLLRAPGAAFLEDAVHGCLERLRAATPPFALGADLQAVGAVQDAERDTGLRLTLEQRLAIAHLLQQHVGLLQGGAGTGKTTSMRVLARSWQAMGGVVLLAALSGKAALRLSSATGRPALTIARLLNGLDRRERLVADGQLDGAGAAGLPEITAATMLVLDEASMVDLGSLHRLLGRMPDGSRLLLVGDCAQLPPVGLGQCFHDLVASGRGVMELTRILRQASDNPILAVAAAIREGREPRLGPFDGVACGVQIVDCSAQSISQELAAVRERLRREAPEDDILVLTGLKRSVTDVNRAQVFRRQVEGVDGVRLGPLCPWAAVGDPVIMGRNHYRHGLMNGQLGTVAGLDPLLVAWDCTGAPQPVDSELRGDIESAWAITVHRSQGSDAARVVVALDGDRLATRQWLYTAVTRARRQVVLVGPRERVAAAVRRRSERTTAFPVLLGGAGPRASEHS